MSDTAAEPHQPDAATRDARGRTWAPHGPFTFHCRDTTTGPDGQPTLYVLCACGRGYAFGHYADSDRLLRWLADHDAEIPCQHRPSMQLRRAEGALYCADCGQTRRADENEGSDTPAAAAIGDEFAQILAFSRRQVDADAAQARDAAARNAAKWSCPSSAVLDTGEDLVIAHDSGVAEHMRRHDPARILVDCAATHALLDELEATQAAHLPAGRLLARVAARWSTRDGYLDQWRPAGLEAELRPRVLVGEVVGTEGAANTDRQEGDAA